MNVKLVVIGGKTNAPEVKLTRLPATIGRGRDCTLTLPHPLVSRHHCEIFELFGRLMVRDSQSLNGTYIGKQRITEAELKPDALLTIGTVTFRAVYETRTSTAGPSAVDVDTHIGDETTPAFGVPDQAEEMPDSSVLEADQELGTNAGVREPGSSQQATDKDDNTQHVSNVVLPPLAAEPEVMAESIAASDEAASQPTGQRAVDDDALNQFIDGLR